MKWFVAVLALLAAGLVVQEVAVGPDLSCPGVTGGAERDYVAGFDGESSPEAALETTAWDGGARVTEERGTGDVESITYRAYDEDDELLRVVGVERRGGRGWYVETDETCQ